MKEANTKHAMANMSEVTIGGKSLNIGKLQNGCLLVGGILTLITALGTFGALGDASKWTTSYLFGLIFWTGITFGMLGLTLLHHTVRGSWSVSILRLLEAGGGVATLGLMLILFMPLVFQNFGGQHSIYEWANLEHVKSDALLAKKSQYLNATWWTIRLLFFFGIWLVMAGVARRSTLKQDQTKNFKLETWRSSFGAAMLPIFVLSVTFAMTDWGMSLDPHWYSTMYGPWTLIGAALGALALTVLIVTTNSDKQPYNTIIGPALTKDLGNMLFVFTMLWGYFSLSQFLIIWNGNLPETTSYFKKRSSNFNTAMGNNNWAALAMMTVVGQFFVPFFSLLAPRTKRFAVNLRKIAGWIFVIHIADVYLLVMPSTESRLKGGPLNAWLPVDLLSFVGIGLLWFGLFAAQTKKASLLPEYDNRLQEALANAH
jgi:hypothetical protein